MCGRAYTSVSALYYRLFTIILENSCEHFFINITITGDLPLTGTLNMFYQDQYNINMSHMMLMGDLPYEAHVL